MGSLNKNKNQTFSKVYKETGPAPVRWSRRWRLSGGMTGGGGGEQRRAGPARGGGGGSHQSAGHHHLLLLLTNSRLGTARFTWSSAQTLRREQDREARRPGAGPAGSAIRPRAPDMLGTVKMEGHEAPDWSGYYNEEVGHRRAHGVRPGPRAGIRARPD